MIVEIGNGLKSTDAYIRIEKDRCILSARACHTLLWSRYAPYIVVLTDTDTDAVYICHSEKKHGYLVRKHQQRGFINSRDLSRMLKEILGSCGSYRICEEEYIIVDGHTCYRIDTHLFKQE